MTKVEQLSRLIYSKHPKLKVSIDQPKNPRGIWWVDFCLGYQKTTVAWRPRHGYGIWADNDPHNFSDRPDEVYKDVDKAALRVVELLTGGRRKVRRREKTAAMFVIGSLKSKEERKGEQRRGGNRRLGRS